MKTLTEQLDLFYDKELSKNVMNWPNDFDGAHHIGPVEFGTTHPGYGAVPPNLKIYESPDKGKTVYEREFGADPSTRTLIKSSVQQQWNITYKSDV